MVELDGGGEVRYDIIIIGTGRSPRTDGLGLDSAGVRLGEHGEVLVDDHCRAAEGIWAIGDVTAGMPFTHVDKYQARIVADNIVGASRTARYGGIPRVVFSPPGGRRRRADPAAADGLLSASDKLWRSERRTAGSRCDSGAVPPL